MRFPWLQVDADFLATGAGDLAELLRTSSGIPADATPISEAEAGWAMVRLWGWAVSKAESPEALGLLADEDMQRLAERAAGWRGAPGAFLAALLRPAVGLAQREEGGAVRLAGMERYASTLRRMEADRARKSTKTQKELQRTSSGLPAEFQRKTQTQTQTQTQKDERELPCAQGAPEPEDLPDATGDAVPVEPGQHELVSSTGPKERPEDLQRLWNEVAQRGLPRWRDMTEKRRRAAAARLRERHLAEWREVVERINRSAFCRGESGGASTWRASPDWLLQPDTATKVLEGKYDGTPGGKVALGPQNGDWSGFDDDVPPAGRAA